MRRPALPRRPARPATRVSGTPSPLVLIPVVMLIVIVVILVFFALGYGLGRLML